MCRWGREAKCHNMILVLHVVAVCTSIVEGWRLVRLTSRSADEGNTGLYMDNVQVLHVSHADPLNQIQLRHCANVSQMSNYLPPLL
jgi:hypothetical protein